MSDEDVTYEKLKEVVEEVKETSIEYCDNCGTHIHKYLLPGAGAFCECKMGDFKENGEEKYPRLYKRWKTMADELKKF